jgi:glycerol kinase
MSYVLALDAGTGSVRSLLVGEHGRIVSYAARSLPLSMPRAGWVEQDPEELWRLQKETIEEVVAKARLSPKAILAIGIANQRETIVLWDREEGQPLYPAILWQDERARDLCQCLQEKAQAQRIGQATGLRLDPYFSAPKLTWLFEHFPLWRQWAKNGRLAVGTVDSWLLWKLTGGKAHRSDLTNASRTLLLNVASGQWDPDLLAFFGVPAPCLPEVCPSGWFLAEAREPGLLRGVPVLAVLGDQQASLFGHGAWHTGQTKCTYGTGAFLLQSTGRTLHPPSHGVLSTIAWAIGPRVTYALEGSVLAAGAVLRWLTEGVGIFASPQEIFLCAAQAPQGSEVMFLPSLCGLGSPYWNRQARGALLGLTMDTTKVHLARAALEGIAMQVVEVCEALEAKTGERLTELRVDGGMAQNQVFLELQADLLGLPLRSPRCVELTGLGAAYLAGLQAGLWKDFADLEKISPDYSFTEPRMSSTCREARRALWKKALSNLLSSG